jgi:hypothetical protein
MRGMLLLGLIMLGCGGSSEEHERSIEVRRFVMPDASQAPYALEVSGQHAACPALDCAPDIRLAVEPAEVVATDALGNVFHIAIDDIGAGPHVVEEPLAPEAGVFLKYRLEYEVR